LVILRTFPYSKFPRKSVLGAACAVLLAACSSGSEPRQPEDVLPPLGDAKLQLVRAASCDELLTNIQESIIVQLQLRAEQLKEGEGYYYGGNVILDNAAPPRDADLAEEESQNGAPGNTPAPTAPENPGVPAGEGTSDGAGGSSGFSGTTVQVKDVDEADIVKTEGDRIYLLHGGTLFVVQGWPADATQILGSAPVEGQPAEMFVSDGKAVVFSRVYDYSLGSGAGAGGVPRNIYEGAGYTKITVLDVSSAVPSVLRESFVEGDYASSRRHGDLVRAVIQDGFKIPQLDEPNIQYRDPFGQLFRQADIDAQVDAWLERTERSIRATGLGAWLPREFTRENGAAVEVAPRCADYYSPDPRLTENGVTSVVALDLADVSAPFTGATILGRAERVYSNEDALLITQTDYRYSYDAGSTEQTIIHRFEIGGSTTTYTASGAVAGTIESQFSLDERDGIIRVSTTEQPRFSGRDVATIGISPPSPSSAPPMQAPPDEPAGEPNIGAAGAGAAGTGAAGAGGASSSDADMIGTGGVAEPPIDPGPVDLPVAPLPPQGPVSVNRVVTLGVYGNTLEVLGSTEDFGQTERIFATRFIGDRAYVVTFRQTDPLFVIDLADPADPHVVGELIIPGFSNYLFPLDESHLFAIGRDATAEGFVQGLALQVFDVSDPAHPALSAKYVYPDVGDSPANVDHRAITFHPDRNVVALPHLSYGTGESNLDVFEIENTSITRLGGVGMSDEIDVDLCLSKYYGYPAGSSELEALRAELAANPTWQAELLMSCRSGNSFRRGLFRDDFVYGISNTGVFVYDLTEMGAGALSEVSLPAEVYAEGGYALGGVTPPGGPLPDLPANGGGSSSGSASPGSSAGGSGSAGASAGGSPGE
jgi:hypothetical protein